MLALARKYRPRDFASVAVQTHVSNTLRGAIARGRVAHGYLLCGPRGTGKTTLARVLAMALNCERRAGRSGELQGEPCGACVSCTRIWSGSSSLDVVEIDAASNRGVDDARELRERAMYAPTGDDRYKVYIVDEAHMLTREAWNALLKILEEPPPRVVFVFATTEPQKIAQAAAPVLSRLQRFDLKRITPADVRARLAAVLGEEGVQWEPDALAMIARAADGSMRDALSLTDQVLSLGDGGVTADRVRDALGLVHEDEYLAILDLVATRRAGDVFGAIGRLADAGVDFALFLTGLAEMIRAQLAVTLGGTLPDLAEHTRATLEARATTFSTTDLLRMLHVIAELEPRFRKSGQQQLLLETMLVRFALLDRSVAIEELLRELGGGAGGGGGAPVAVPPRRDPAVGPSPEWRGDRPAPAAPVMRADAPDPPPSGGQPPELNRVAERWEEVVQRLRAEGKALLVGALEHAMPVAVNAKGEITLELDQPNEILRKAVEGGARDVTEALRALFPGVMGITTRLSSTASPAPPLAARRITTESVKAERIAMLRKRDPTLGAAIDALDLELLD